MAKILLVEDDNNLREIYEARLQAEGYTIVSAMDGEAALVVAKKERPDLVISDVMMPRISGFEMLDILRNTEGLKDVKVIMLTALGQAEDKTRADALGADRYLVKSQVTLEDIVKAAQELLGPETGPSAPQATAAAAEQATVMAAAPTSSAAPPQAAAPITSVPTPAPAAPVTAATPAPAMPTASTGIPPMPVIPPQPPPSAVPTPKLPDPTTNQAIQTPQVAPTSQSVVPSSTTPQAQSSSTEEAAIKAQIENFVNQNNQTAPAAPTQPVPASETMMADAIKNLVSDTTSPTTAQAAPPKLVPPPTTFAPPQPSARQTVPDDDSVTVAHKKVISPISNPEATPQVGLDELLAKEGLTTFDDETRQYGSEPSAPTTNPALPTQPAIPSSLPTTPHPPGHVISPNSGNSVDPNSIAL